MIRAAVLIDLAALTEIEAACFGDDAWTSSLVEAELTGDTRSVLVAIDGGVVVGYGSIMVVGDLADLQRIAVLPEARRFGLGSELLDKLLVTASSHGATRILLEVAAFNDHAIGLYESFNFEVIARRRRYYADKTDALVMERALGKPS